MSQQLLDGPVGHPHATAGAVGLVARAVAAPPDTQALAAALTAATTWPLEDAESRRGSALLAESRLAGEGPERLRRDHARLFTGEAGRVVIAPSEVPVDATPALQRLLGELTSAGVVRLPSANPAGLADVLVVLATVDTAAAQLPAATLARWRQELVGEHLLGWGARCLSRVQLGAQTYFYQGIAALGLGLLRREATAVH